MSESLSWVSTIVGFLGGVTFCWGCVAVVGIVIGLKAYANSKTEHVDPEE